MKNFLGGARLSWRRIVLLLTAIAVAAGVAIGLTVWASFDAAAATIPPGARVVKALNSIGIERFNEGPAKDGGRRVIFVSGDHPEPVEFVKELIASFGFAPIHLGGLVVGGRLQQAGGPLAGRDLVDFGYH